ncbi:MAG: Lin0512 family protein, partial [Chloroflexi bacterium]|nr:Lin0512 family protein [Chloroflexota bacterium]
MIYKRFAIELGMGVDLHGEDYTKASVKAVKDAVSRVCLSGLVEVLNLSLDDIRVEVILGIPKGGEIKEEEVRKAIPIGKVEV